MTKANELKIQGGAGLATLQRPHFSAGLLLEDEDLTAGVDYTRNMTRLLFRSLFGCGVICGLRVTAKTTCHGSKLTISVARGLALDCMGNPIEVPRDTSVTYDSECKPIDDSIWVAVCYTEKCCRPRDISCSPDDDGHVVQTRTHDGYEVKLYNAPPQCACSCEKGEDDTLDPRNGGCCKEHGADTAAGANASATLEAPTLAKQELTEQERTCACYKEHNEGKCACDCGCHCVVIARICTKIDKDEKEIKDSADHELFVKDNMRREIRPLLTGYLGCLESKATALENKAAVESNAAALETRVTALEKSVNNG